MDSRDGVFFKEHLVNTADSKVMLQIGFHPFQINTLKMAFRHYPGGQGLGRTVGKLIDKIVLSGQDDRQPGLGVFFELADRMQLRKDVKTHQ